MLYKETKKEALAIHKRAVNKYNEEYQEMAEKGNQLYRQRRDSVFLIHQIELLVNSIANRPKEFETKITDFQSAREKFRNTEEYAAEASEAAVKAGSTIAAGVAGGVAVAGMAPTAAMWVATTFGTASTGTAISSLSGTVATKAALAWLGGGTLSAGGAGIAGGKALLALAGPIGWGISGAATTLSLALLGYKNKQIADEAIDEAKKITIAGAELNEASAKIQHLMDETVMLMDALRDTVEANRPLSGANYLGLSRDEQVRLGTMVNNTLTLAQLLNKTI